MQYDIMQVSLRIRCMNRHYYNGRQAHIIEIHKPMLQIHGGTRTKSSAAQH